MLKKIKYLLLLSFIIILGLCTKSQARIITNDPTVSSGETVTVTIDSEEEVAYGAIDIASNEGLTFVSASGGETNGTFLAFSGSANKTTGIATYTFKAPTVTETKTFKVVFKSKDMGNKDYEEVASSQATATVTVEAPKTSGNDDKENNNNTSNENESNDNQNENTVTEPTFTKTNKTVYSKKEINLRASWSTSSEAVTIDRGTELTLTGTSNERIDGYIWYRVTYKGETKYVASTLITTEKPEEEEEEKKSDDNSLKSLKVTPSGLTPNFDSETKNYELTIGSDVDDIEIEAIATDENAKVKITGNEDLTVGQNTIKIVVTAEDGTERIYKIVVTKENEEQLGLKELLIEGISLSPEFEQDVYNYTVKLEDTDTKELNITATASRKNAEVEIVGNTDLKVGENNITIMVKADDGETVTYQIAVTIKEPTTQASASPVEDSSDNSNDLKKYVVIGAVALIIIAIIVIIVSKKEEIDDEEYDLQPLSDEDLPKSLRKNKKEESNLKENEIQLPVEKDLKEKIDELMSDEDSDDFKPSGRGKHF